MSQKLTFIPPSVVIRHVAAEDSRVQRGAMRRPLNVNRVYSPWIARPAALRHAEVRPC
jgi:hypothetical protein